MMNNHKNIKILFITKEFPPDPGGIGNQSFNIVKELSNTYCIKTLTDVLNFDKHNLKKIATANNLKIYWIKRRKIAMITYLERILRSIILAYSSHIIIYSGKFSLWLLFLHSFLMPNRKKIAIVHGSELLLPNLVENNLVQKGLSRADTIISVSHYTESHLPKYPNRKQNRSVIPNGINLSEFKMAACVRKLETNKAPILITVGSISDRKGQLNVIRALTSLKKIWPDIKYHMVGMPYKAKEILEEASKLGVAENIKIFGALSRNSLLEELSKADIFCMLSVKSGNGDFEGFGIAIIEANAMGLPALGSSGCGIEDAINHGYNGFLVNPINPNEVVDRIIDICQNYTLMSENSINWAKKHSWEEIIKQYQHKINSLQTSCKKSN